MVVSPLVFCFVGVLDGLHVGFCWMLMVLTVCSAGWGLLLGFLLVLVDFVGWVYLIVLGACKYYDLLS